MDTDEITVKKEVVEDPKMSNTEDTETPKEKKEKKDKKKKKKKEKQEKEDSTMVEKDVSEVKKQLLSIHIYNLTLSCIFISSHGTCMLQNSPIKEEKKKKKKNKEVSSN